MLKKLSHFSLMILMLLASQQTLACDHDEGLPTLLTHQSATADELPETLLQEIEARLRASSTLYLPLEEELAHLWQMTDFELGRFLLLNGGINGYWTAYWLIHGPQKDLTNPLEHWLINKAPSFMASRERAGIFKRETQARLKDGMCLASVPCGLMDDLVRLDYTNAPSARLFGYDLDEASLSLAKTNAAYHAPSQAATFYCVDAWKLPQDASFDLLTSNGLNFYVPEDSAVITLYKTFFGALKPGGVLITSFLTPPPSADPDSKWQLETPLDMQKQMAIFKDLMSAKWTGLRSEILSRTQLQEAGFLIEDVIYDSQGLFPTVIAKKPA
ncbi:MAG: class I SAM-dependent methyltransferase [Alphaproteobacteria bacterium]|jgi:SAM-dependent methyltransferase|nr:methyltransferase domain-containing protein [Alphaproteobacteria bacterium]